MDCMLFLLPVCLPAPVHSVVICASCTCLQFKKTDFENHTLTRKWRGCMKLSDSFEVNRSKSKVMCVCHCGL